MYGKKHWFFPDAEQPPKGTNAELPGHESIIILNPNSEDAKVEIVLYWTDKTPSEPLKLIVQAGRVKCSALHAARWLNGFACARGRAVCHSCSQ